MSTLSPDAILQNKKTALRGRLDYAAAQVDALEQIVSSGKSIDRHRYESARAEFIVAIPNSSKLFGCSSSCSLFCKCSHHLFETELAERHQLYMRYFDAKEAARDLISEVEQTSFAIPGVKQCAVVAQKRKPNTTQQHTSEEVQLEIEL